MSWASGIQEPLKLLRTAALNKEAVRVVSIRQKNTPGRHALSAKASRHTLRRGLAASVGVGIENKINGPRAVAQLLKLPRTEMIPQRTGDVMEACLPQNRIIEQAFHQHDLLASANQFPCV